MICKESHNFDPGLSLHVGPHCSKQDITQVRELLAYAMATQKAKLGLTIWFDHAWPCMCKHQDLENFKGSQSLCR